MYCTKCGKNIADEAVICLHCGCATSKAQTIVNDPSMPTNSERKNSISLILGIIGIVGAWLFALIGHISSIIGIVIGIKEYKETSQITGLALSIVGEICSIISSIIGVIAFSGMF